MLDDLFQICLETCEGGSKNLRYTAWDARDRLRDDGLRGQGYSDSHGQGCRSGQGWKHDWYGPLICPGNDRSRGPGNGRSSCLEHVDGVGYCRKQHTCLLGMITACWKDSTEIGLLSMQESVVVFFSMRDSVVVV